MSEKKNDSMKESGQKMEDAVKAAVAEDTAAKAPEVEKAARKKRKTVKFQLFKDNDKYKGDLFVGVNGVGYLLKRGVPLDLPVGVYNAVRNSGEQLQMAQDLSDELEYSDENK